jgi:hypothetical protein
MLDAGYVDGTAEPFGVLMVMCNRNQCGVMLCGVREHDIHNARAVGGIQITGGFITEQQ